MDEAKRKEFLERIQASQRSYAARLPQQLRELEAEWTRLLDEGADSWSADSLENLHRSVHTIAGSAGTFGLPQVGEQARLVEQSLKSILGKRARPIEEISQGLLQLRKVATTALQEARPLPVVLPTAPAARPSGNLIHLLDHDPEAMEAIIHQLEYYGYKALPFTDLHALRAASPRPAAVIVDVDMVRDEVPTGQADVPVIFMAREDDMASRLDAVRRGCLAYLRKPLDPANLIDILDGCLNVHEEKRFRVLIVDDSTAMAHHLSLTLAGAGMETRQVHDPLQLLGPLTDFQPDLILMDLYMPGCSGLEAAAVVRQLETFVSVPIVYLSAEKDISKQLLAMGQGGDDFLTKPIAPEHLLSAVTSRIRRARAMRSFMVRDGLTGLLNHTTTKDRLVQEVERARRLAKPLCFAVLDIDHFKMVNDTYGHPTGDRVIKGLARLLKQRLRRSDVVGRFGGEEFAVILPDTDGRTAAAVLNELRDTFSHIEHRHQETRFCKSFSCGVAPFPGYGEAKDLNDAADLALYEAKRGGRNRVVLAPTEGAE